MKKLDYKCWLQGLYVHDGNGKLIMSLKQLLVNLFSKHKDTKKIPSYPERPYLEQQELEKEQEQKQQRDYKYEQYEDNLVYWGSLKQRMLEKFKNKK